MTIKSCTCYSPYQDAQYGKGKRVFNRTAGSTKAGSSTRSGHRCTVCSRMVYRDTPRVEVAHDK